MRTLKKAITMYRQTTGKRPKVICMHPSKWYMFKFRTRIENIQVFVHPIMPKEKVYVQ